MLSKEQKDKLVKDAAAAGRRAYAPYSRYHVGAALLTASGKTYTGANVENAAYPLSMCAESVAVFKAVSDGEVEFQAIAVVTRNGGSPCGACREVLSEFGLETIVLIADESGDILSETSVNDLLPAAFGSDKLLPSD